MKQPWRGSGLCQLSWFLDAVWDAGLQWGARAPGYSRAGPDTRPHPTVPDRDSLSGGTGPSLGMGLRPSHGPAGRRVWGAGEWSWGEMLLQSCWGIGSGLRGLTRRHGPWAGWAQCWEGDQDPADCGA